MFRIGEFAQIAQVSTRQLRFYDQLGLLQPVRADAQTGYRYYSIRQLPRLNSILALKELGLSLEQIGPLLKDAISAAELRGMLTMKSGPGGAGAARGGSAAASYRIAHRPDR
ncbi:MerR family transcriptional regulator [Bradyrhizobium sp.]|uniref:MerR family transcriptional regulator n=1 Tax=Bradyrhizobium sp. TaxID=376 RepID=UPI003C6BC9FF